MEVLIFDKRAEEKIKQLRQYAERHVWTEDDIKAVINGQKPPAGDTIAFEIILDIGHRIVFTVEQRLEGRYRHISLSVDTPGKLPSFGAVQEIIKLFGFKNDLLEKINTVYLEDCPDGQQAVNILELEPEETPAL